METWPTTLPQWVLQEQYSEWYKDPVIRTEMDAGPTKERLRYTAVPQVFTISIVVTQDQMNAFETFYKNNIAFGALPFEWRHPRTQSVETCKIISQYTSVAHGMDFIVSFEMEILP